MIHAYTYANFLISSWGTGPGDGRQMDLLSDTIKFSLHTDGSTAGDVEGIAIWSDVDNEISETGYTSGGATLGSKTITYDSTLKTVTFKTGAAIWGPSSPARTFTTPRWGVMYNESRADQPLIAHVEFGTDISNPFMTTGEAYTVGTTVFTPAFGLSVSVQTYSQSQAHWYPKAWGNAWGGFSSGQARMTHWVDDTIKCSLHTSAYVPSESHEVYADLTNQLSGGGYTSGGITVPNRYFSFDATPAAPKTHILTSDSPINFPTLTQPDIRWAVIYNDSGTDKALIGYIDLGGVACVAEDLNINHNPSFGLLSMRNTESNFAPGS